jgi:hypothetical protein
MINFYYLLDKKKHDKINAILVKKKNNNSLQLINKIYKTYIYIYYFQYLINTFFLFVSILFFSFH